MKRLVSPLFGHYCLTGASMDNQWQEELSQLNIPKRVQRGSIPFHADLRWWFSEHYHDGTLLEDLQGIDLSKIFGGPIEVDPPQTQMKPLPGIVEEEIWSGEPITYTNGGYPGSIHTIRLHTRYGTLTSSESYASRSFGLTEHPIKQIEDLRIVQYVYEKRAEHASEDFIPSYMAKTVVQAFLIELAGLTTAVPMLLEYTEEIAAYFDFMEELYEPVIAAMAPSFPMIFSVENLSSEISGGFWDSYLAPQLHRRVQNARKFGSDWGIHHDGKLMPLLGRLHEIDIRWVNGITAAPSGDLDPLKLREVAGPDITLVDILPQAIFMPGFSEKAFDEYVRRVVDFYHDDKKIVLGVGDMLPVNGYISRVEKVIDIIEELTS